MRIAPFYRRIVPDISGEEVELPTLDVANLTPQWSITVLERTGDDPSADFRSLQRFLRSTALKPGRAVSVSVTSEITLGTTDPVDELSTLEEFGFSHLYGLSRTSTTRPAWAGDDSDLVDVGNQLTIAVMRNDLVAIHTGITTEAQMTKWIYRQLAPFRPLPADLVTNTFTGDATMVWTRGIHRRRVSKSDYKTLGGMRVQEVLNTLEDNTYALTATKVNYQPSDETATLRSSLTVSAKSRLAWRRAATFAEFLAVTVEALDKLEKSIADGDSLDPLFPELARPVTNLDGVHGAFDISVSDPDQLRSEPDADDDLVARAELLRDAILDVRGDPDSARAEVDVGYDGVHAGTLSVQPTGGQGAFTLDVRYARTPTLEPVTREIKEAIGPGDLLTLYYESGHAFTNQSVARQQLVSRPFPHVTFEDFSGFQVTREKPKANGDQAIHDSIGTGSDDSLFGWVAHHYGTDWLLCDDGAGEAADFLHLDNNGTVTAIHVKAADSASSNRRIAVARFEQVVSQAEKNIRLLNPDALVEHVQHRPIGRPAAWRDGERIDGREVARELAARNSSDKANVVIVQPHLLQRTYDDARKAADEGRPNRDSRSLALLDNLLHSTRRTVTAQCDDLMIIGCR